MKHYLILILLLVSIGMIYFATRYYQINGIQKHMINAIEEYSQRLSLLKSSDNNRMHEFTKNGMLINSDMTVSDAQNNIYKLTDILSENNLILRYFENNCNTCIVEQFNLLKTCSDSLKLRNIIILATHENYIQMSRYLKTCHLPYKAFNINNESSLSIEDIGAPYYFVIDKKSMRINDMFVPAKELPDLTIKYLSSVKMKYFSNIP